MTITEFLLARIAEDEAVARAASQGRVWTWDIDRAELVSDFNDKYGPECIIDTEGGADPPGSLPGAHIARHDPARVLAECEAKRRIVKLHKAWPVLVQQPPEFENFSMSDDPNSMTARMSQRMKWMTEQEYRARFTDEPPTAPMIRVLAAVYADHPDYDEAWRC